MRTIRSLVGFLVSLTLAIPTSTRADQADDAYPDFQAGRYSQVFNRLFPYRIKNEGTLRVDFMLAVSACRLQDSDFKALGGFLLAAIPAWYAPLRADQLADIDTQTTVCPTTGITEQQAFASLSGKTDSSAKGFSPNRSSSGKDQSLPAAPVSGVVVQPPPSMMGPLMEGQAYLQGDYRDASVPSAAACSALCARETQCMAMTFIVDQNRCWLKSRIPATANAPGMISAAKMSRPPASMGALVNGQGYPGADYRNTSVPSAADCSALCAREKQCVAMTFVIGEKRCWLKSSVPALAKAPGMISAAKIAQ